VRVGTARLAPTREVGVAAEVMLIGVAKVALEEGAKFLYEQAGKVLEAWRARREDPAAPAPIVVAAPPQVTVGPSHPSSTVPTGETVVTLGDLHAKVERLAKGERSVDDPAARATIAALREILEAALGTSITFAGEPDRPIQVSDINIVVNDVSGWLTGVIVDGRKGTTVKGVTICAHDVPAGGRLVGVQVGGGGQVDPAGPAQPEPPIRILFLAANPIDTARLRLDEEAREIDEALREAEYRDRFEVKQQWAVRSDDLQKAFLRHRPNIVHFSGHGTQSSEIVLEDEKGMMRAVSPKALSGLFSEFKTIRCVVLNACYSEQQAQAIAEHVDCVVGMTRAVEDAAAIQFATGFYRALGYGETVQTAFDLGRNQTVLEGLPAADTPHLVAKNPKAADASFVSPK